MYSPLKQITAIRADTVNGSFCTASPVVKSTTYATRKPEEEAVETVTAEPGGDKARLISEIVDLIYHLPVMRKISGSWPDELARHITRGSLQEKKARIHV